MSHQQGESSNPFLEHVRVNKPITYTTPSPAPEARPLAHATPLFQRGDGFFNVDLQLPTDIGATIQEDELVDDIEGNEETGEERKKDGKVASGEGGKAKETFAATPAERAVGRTGLSREQMLLKLCVLHRFGVRCIVTLMCVGLQLAHVIPVKSSPQDLTFLEWVFGDLFGTLNIHSFRNLWLVNATTHYALDRGLIKIVPTADILGAILEFSEQVEEKHRGKLSNKDIGLDRRRIFPPGNYSYVVVGILCSPRFFYPRERLDGPEPADVPEVQTVENEEYEFSYKPIDYPIKIPPRAGGLDSDEHLKGYLTNLKTPFDACRPVEHSSGLELMSWQDPWLVTANVGEFLYVLKGQIDEERQQKAQKEGGEWKEWKVDELVHDVLHRSLLQLCLQIYDFWMKDQAPKPQKEKGSRATRSRQAKSGAEVSSNVAGPSNLGQNQPTTGPLTRSRSKNAGSNADAEAAAGTGGPVTRARSGKGKGKGKSKTGTGTAPSRGKSTRSKGGASNRGN